MNLESLVMSWIWNIEIKVLECEQLSIQIGKNLRKLNVFQVNT